jgi:hypothetical protein
MPIQSNLTTMYYKLLYNYSLSYLPIDLSPRWNIFLDYVLWSCMYVCMAIQIAITLPATSCPVERSFR